MIKKISIIFSFLILTYFGANASKEVSSLLSDLNINTADSCFCKKNIIKVFGLAWATFGAISIGNEFMFSKRISMDYVYSTYISVGDNGSTSSSFRIGTKYYIKGKKNYNSLNKFYGGLFLKYRYTESWIDQAEFDHIESRVFGTGIFLGRLSYLTKWLLLEYGLNTMIARKKSSRYGDDFIFVGNDRYKKRIYLYSNKKEWKIFPGLIFLVGIRF